MLVNWWIDLDIESVATLYIKIYKEVIHLKAKKEFKTPKMESVHVWGKN